MKRLLAFTVVLAMVFTMTVGYAAPVDDLFAVLSKTKTSSTMTCDIAFELEDTLEFLKSTGVQYDTFLDTYGFTESVFRTTSTMTGTVNVSEDYQKMSMYMSMELDAPLHFNDNFKTELWARFDYWIDMDFTDPDNPVYTIIYKMPMGTKYYVMDYTKLLGQEGQLELLRSMLTKSSIEAIQKDSLKALQDNAEITYHDGVYTVTMTQDGFKEYMRQAFILSYNMSAEGLEDTTELDQAYDAIYTMLDEIEFIGDDGITIEYGMDENGDITTEKASVDLAIPYQTYNEDYILTKDMYHTDMIQAKLHVNVEYVPSDSVQEIQFPVLTEENSIDMSDNIGYVYEDYMYVVYEDLPVIENGSLYIPLRPLMGEYHVDGDNITWDNGSILVTSEDDFSKFETLRLSAGSTVVEKDGTSITLDLPVIERKDTTYVPEEFLQKVLDSELQSFEILPFNNEENDTRYSTSYIVTRENTDFLEDYEMYDEPFTYEPYVPPYFYVSCRSAGEPVIENGSVYIPVVSLADGLGMPEDSVVTEGNTVKMNSGFKYLPFGYVKFTAGSNSVEKDGEIFIYDQPVLDRNGVICVSDSCMKELLDISINNLGLIETSSGKRITNYSLHAKNPNYVDTMTEGPYYFMYVTENTLPVIDNGNNYVPLNPLMGEFKIRYENIVYEDNTVTILADDAFSGFGTIRLTAGSNTVEKDGEIFTLNQPLYEKNGVYYISEEFIETILNARLIRFNTNYWNYQDGDIGYETEYLVRRDNPDYVPPVEE